MEYMPLLQQIVFVIFAAGQPGHTLLSLFGLISWEPSEDQQTIYCLIVSFGPWTKSQAGLVSCLEPWKNIALWCSSSSGYPANLVGRDAATIDCLCKYAIKFIDFGMHILINSVLINSPHVLLK